MPTLRDDDDPALRYYRKLRDALLEAKQEPELRQRNFIDGVSLVLRNLALLLLEQRPPVDLDEVKALEPEFRDAAIVFLLSRRKPPPSGDVLEFYSDRLEELGGAERIFSDPDIHTITDVIEKLNPEPWIA
jgi:hypothetical protein